METQNDANSPALAPEKTGELIRLTQRIPQEGSPRHRRARQSELFRERIANAEYNAPGHGAIVQRVINEEISRIIAADRKRPNEDKFARPKIIDVRADWHKRLQKRAENPPEPER